MRVHIMTIAEVRHRLSATLYARRLARVPEVRQKRAAEARTLVTMYRAMKLDYVLNHCKVVD